MELSPIDARRAVWIAQSDLFLDTDVRLHYANLAHVAANSPFPLDELEAIFRDEVAPVFEYNLMDIAGEWAMFANDDVIRSVEGYLARNPPRPYLMETWALDYWRDVVLLIEAMRRLPDSERAARYQLWRDLSGIILHSIAPKPVSLADPELAERVFRSELMPVYDRMIDSYNDPTRAEIEARWRAWREAAQT